MDMLCVYREHLEKFLCFLEAQTTIRVERIPFVQSKAYMRFKSLRAWNHRNALAHVQSELVTGEI